MYKNLVDKVLSKYWRNKFTQIFEDINFIRGTHRFYTTTYSADCIAHYIYRKSKKYDINYYIIHKECRIERGYSSSNINHDTLLYYN